MNGLTPAQFAQMGGQPLQQSTPSPQGGLSSSEFAQMGGTPVTQSQGGQSQNMQGMQPASTGFFHPLDALSNQYNNAIATTKEGFQSGVKTAEKGGLVNNIHGAAQGGLGAASGALGAIFAPFSASADALIPEGNSELGKFASDTAKSAVVGAEFGTIIPGAGTVLGGGIGALFGAGMHVVNRVKDAIFTHTNLSEPDKAMINNALNVGLAVIGQKVGKAETEGQGLDTPVSEIPNAIRENLPSLPKLFQKSPEEVAMKQKAQMQEQLKSVQDDWAKPATINESKYNNARAVLEKDPEVPQTLAQNKLNPFSAIEDGKYLTKDMAQSLREDTGQLSKNLLRPSLQHADYQTEPISVGNLKVDINNLYGVTADDAEAISAKVNTKLEALSNKYPDGMNLTNQLDEKIIYDKNGGYKAYKSNADNIDAIANRAIADSLRESLINTAPQDIPVKDFLSEQAKNYRAADYLDALNGKKAPVSPLQSAVRYGAKILGAKTLGQIGGGDLVSEFVGYHAGGTLERFIENMTNPMRDSFLQNLKITNPKAFSQVEQFIGASEAARATILKLPAGAPLGTETNPIITPAPSEESQMQGRARTIFGEDKPMVVASNSVQRTGSVSDVVKASTTDMMSQYKDMLTPGQIAGTEPLPQALTDHVLNDVKMKIAGTPDVNGVPGIKGFNLPGIADAIEGLKGTAFKSFSSIQKAIMAIVNKGK